MTDMTDVDRCHEAALARRRLGESVAAETAANQEYNRACLNFADAWSACPDRERPEGGMK